MRAIFGMLIVWMLCAAGACVSLLWMLAATFGASPRAWRIAIAIDEAVNIALGGWEFQTISGRCWKYRAEQPYKTLRWVIDAAFGLAGFPAHCEMSCMVEDARIAERAREVVSEDKEDVALPVQTTAAPARKRARRAAPKISNNNKPTKGARNGTASRTSRTPRSNADR
jgi:hypothetical protein